jgi:hypothetical protein
MDYISKSITHQNLNYWPPILWHLFSVFPKFHSETFQKIIYRENPNMTRLKLNSWWVKNLFFPRLYLWNYNDPRPEIFTRGTLIYRLSNLQISLSEASWKKVIAKIPRCLTWSSITLGLMFWYQMLWTNVLRMIKSQWIKVHCREETSFSIYPIQKTRYDEMRWS